MTPRSYDVEKIRSDFPILGTRVDGHPLVYLDTGASAQKPRAVIDAMTHMMEADYANVHRGSYALSERSTHIYEAARKRIATYLNARRPEEIVFTLNATDAINLVANTFGASVLKPGQAVLISQMEHHSNIVPWQMVRDARGVRLLVCPILDDGTLDMDAFERLVQDNVGLVAITQTSNVLGTIPPVDDIIRQAHAVGAKVLLDGCQGIVHGPVDVQALDVDFYVFSAHKLYGPTGLGVLYGKHQLLSALPPWRGGGDMIETVTFERSTWAPPPARFEAGTPPIVQTAGIAAAIDYVSALGAEAIAHHEADILAHATACLSDIKGLRLIGTSPRKAAVLSFLVNGVHPHDLGMILGARGVCVRVGHHCAEPLMNRLGIPGTVRASLGLYTNRDDINALVKGLQSAIALFA